MSENKSIFCESSCGCCEQIESLTAQLSETRGKLELSRRDYEVMYKFFKAKEETRILADKVVEAADELILTTLGGEKMFVDLKKAIANYKGDKE